MVITRRNFLNRLLSGGAALVFVYLIYPLVRFLIPPPVPLDGESRIKVAASDELKLNTAKFFRFLDKPAVLLHLPDGKYEALSAKCTHLGCTVAFEQSEEVLYCNCHGSEFGLDGKVLKGPAELPLSQYAVSFSGSNIYVTAQQEQISEVLKADR